MRIFVHYYLHAVTSRPVEPRDRLFYSESRTADRSTTGDVVVNQYVTPCASAVVPPSMPSASSSNAMALNGRQIGLVRTASRAAEQIELTPGIHDSTTTHGPPDGLTHRFTGVSVARHQLDISSVLTSLRRGWLNLPKLADSVKSVSTVEISDNCN